MSASAAEGNDAVQLALARATETCARLEAELTAVRQDGDALLQAAEARFQGSQREIESLNNEVARLRTAEGRAGLW